MDMNEVVDDRLGKIPVETDYQRAFLEALAGLLHGRSETETIQVAGNLARFMIDHVSSELSAIRRTAAHKAKTELGMTVVEIADESQQSVTSVSRLLTEYRSLIHPRATKATKKKAAPTT